MITNIKISYLNDFIFCPLSIYFHNLYGDVESDLYKDIPQKQGTYAHESIDNFQYSHKANILTGIDVYSEEYNLYGKIDIFNIETGDLIERKKKIINIYDGYIFQLYAQYYCLEEMGYKVKSLKLYSKDDNKYYNVDLPSSNPIMLIKFNALISQINSFNLFEYKPNNMNKCKNCIYRNSCDRCLYDEFK